MKRIAIITGIFVMIVLVIGAGKAVAQLFVQSTEPGDETMTTSVKPSYVSGDPAYQNITPPDDNPAEGTANPGAEYAYYLVPGATLRGRSTAVEYKYGGDGCSYITLGSGFDRILNTELHLPKNAVIKFLRVYYVDTNPASGVDGFLTRYTPGQGFIDLAKAPAPDNFSSGFGFTVSEEITETVNNDLYAYTLIGLPDENNIANQICGLRIAYYTPIITVNNIYLPRVNR